MKPALIPAGWQRVIFSDPRLPAKNFFLLCFLDLEKKLLSHIKEKTVSLKRGSKKWVEDAGSRSLPQAID